MRGRSASASDLNEDHHDATPPDETLRQRSLHRHRRHHGRHRHRHRPAAAAPITLTFDGLGMELYPESWTESGFIITLLEPSGGHLHAGADELLLHSRQGSSPYQIRREDGGHFDFLGFDYSGGDSVFVTDGGASFTILGEQPRATFTMAADFHDVGYVLWYMNNPGDLDFPDPQWGIIDNIATNVPPAPEPSEVALLGLGLAGLLLHRHRMRRPAVRA
jgi:hypothetical protein